MNHPLFHLFGFDGSGDMMGTVSHPNEARDYVWCKPCGRWYGATDYAEPRAKFRRRRADDFYHGAPDVPVGPEWPEAVSVRGMGAPLVRGDVIEIMLESGITGFVPRAVDLAVDDDNQLSRPVPEFFHLEITGRVAVTWPENPLITVCPICRHRTDSQWGDAVMYPDMTSWTGDDLVGTSNVWTNLVFCTRRLIDLAQAEGWSSFRFGDQIPHCPVRFMDVPDWFSDLQDRTIRRYPRLFPSEQSGGSSVA